MGLVYHLEKMRLMKDKKYYFLGSDGVSIAIARQYLTGSEMETTYYYDNMPYVTLRAPGWYMTVTIALDNNPENAICICMTKKQVKEICKGIKGLYKKKKR